jgi:hypothetical protein
MDEREALPNAEFGRASYFVPFGRKEKTQMTRKKVLIIGLAIILLGGVQVYRWHGSRDRASSMGTASGMMALLSGVAIGLYGLGLKDKR